MEDALRIPSATKQAKLIDMISDDETFRFDRIKPLRDKPRFEIPDPTPEDEDNTRTVKSFTAAVVLSRKNWYQDDKSKEKGEEPKAKRALYILRSGKVTPELIYINPTSVKEWLKFCRDITEKKQALKDVLVEFGLKQVTGKTNGFTWNIHTFSPARALTAAEREYVESLAPPILERVKQYEQDTDLEKYENAALGVEDNDEDEESAGKKSKRSLEHDDEDEAPKKRGRPSAGAAPAKAKKKAVDDDDDEDEPPAKAKKKVVEDDDDDDEPVAKKKKVDDDDDEDEPKKPAESKRKSIEDDDDDED